MTPGKVQPGIGTGRSIAPVASRIRRAVTVSLTPSVASESVPSGSMCHTVVAGRYWAPLVRNAVARG